ncbi:MAG: ArsA family ATPase [Candidatus Euphemobacter frigidus]|nr:ArsA family ATPase [Candidatus Euphemobacter frigidus]
MFRNIEDRSLIIFGGKGGCGKTTSACAAGLYLARAHPGKKILIVSCDPAHSVGDSFERAVGNTITRIGDVDNLSALEIEAEEDAIDFKKKYGSVLKKIAERGTYFDRRDIENFFSLSIPGLDEVMAVIKIANILKEEEFDLVILDTAPTGHAIRLLGLPAQMKKWIKVLNLMQAKHRFLARHFTGRYRKDDTDEFLEMMAKDVKRVRGLLKNRDLTEFIPVTIPHSLAIEETERLLRSLKGYGIPVKSIIINKINSSRNQCPFCSREEKEQKKELNRIDRKFADYELFRVPAFPYQIRGLERLKEYAEVLFEGKTPCLPAGKKLFNFKSRLAGVNGFKRSPSDLIEDDILLYVFGGKGGVGKTSIASATALTIAARYPSRKVLIFSTDPAHSLSDSFGLPVGDSITRLGETDNLYGLEMDAPKLFEDYKKTYRKEINEAFTGFFNQGVDIKFDREVFEGLISLTPPGLDEIMALTRVVDFIDEGKFDLYVLDNAATGHMLRFLEMPRVAREWLNTIFKLLIKYKEVVRLSRVAEEMIELSRKVRKLQEILMDPARCRFVVISIPEVMGKDEMDDLLESFNRLEIPCRRIIINMVLPATGCNFCESRRKEQTAVIREINRERTRKYEISRVPLLPYQVKGPGRLKKLAGKIYG